MKNKLKQVSFGIGIAIVVGTHAYMLFAGLPSSQMMGHAILNLIAGGSIIYSQLK